MPSTGLSRHGERCEAADGSMETPMNIARHRAALYWANIVCASAHAVACFFVAVNYELWLPHPVGHLTAMVAIFVAAVWSLHCVMLGGGCGLSRRNAMRNAAWPFALVCVAAVACWIHYRAEYAQPWKVREWFEALPR